MKNIHPGKFFTIVLSLIISLFLIGLIGGPYLIDTTLERWISSHGPEIAQVENIDFNPFSGRLSMDNLVVETKNNRTFNISHAYLAFSWKQLFKKQLYLKELVLQDTYLLVERFEDIGFRVGGLILDELAGAEGKSDEPGWEVGIGNLEIQNAVIEYDTPEFAATYFIDRYSLTGLETWNKQKPVEIELDGRINESPVHIKARGNPLDVAKSFGGSIVIEKFSLELLHGLPELQKYSFGGLVDISLQLNAQVLQDASIIFDTEGWVTLNRLWFKHKEHELQQEKLHWQGNISGNAAAGQKLSVSVAGKLTGAGLLWDGGADPLQLFLGAFNWQGKAGMSQQDNALAVTSESSLEGNDFRVNDQHNDSDLLNLKKFNITGIQVSGLESVLIEKMDLMNLRLAEKRLEADAEQKKTSPPLLQVSAVTISNAGLQTGNDLVAGEVRLQDVEASVLRDKAGNWQVMTRPPDNTGGTAAAQQGPEAAETAAGKSPFRMRLDSLEVAGKSFIRFEDESLQQPFRAIFHINKLQLVGMDTAETASPARFNLSGRIEDYGTVAIEGSARPLKKNLALDMKGTVNALDMVPFSSYTGRTIGYNVTSGQMDADIEMDIDSGKLDGIFGLKMRKLKVGRINPDQVSEIDSRMDVPLGTALSVLRDKKDEISLKLELKGDTGSPKFGIQDAINQALARAMKYAAVSYLKYTLQPFGTYIAVAQVVGKAGKEIAKLRLDPVKFPAAEVVLDETAARYLSKIQEVMAGRPELRLELCSKAVVKDRVALLERRQAVMKKEEVKGARKPGMTEVDMTVSDEILLDFARERAKLVKETLVKQHGINHERIYLCLPAIDEAPDIDPYVSIFLD